jgi:hypothetical protein
VSAGPTERPDAAPLARARAAALGELRRAPIPTPWTRQAALVVSVWVGIALLAGAATVLAAIATPAGLAARAPLLIALLALAVGGGIASLAPRGRGWTAVMLVAAPLTMVALVGARGAGLPSATPGWVCSVSHVGLGLIPLAVGLWALRQSAWSWPRALTVGLGAGTAGAFLGELACHQGARHVLVHHLGAWLFIALACLAISRQLKPRSYAP